MVRSIRLLSILGVLAAALLAGGCGGDDDDDGNNNGNNGGNSFCDAYCDYVWDCVMSQGGQMTRDQYIPSCKMACGVSMNYCPDFNETNCRACIPSSCTAEPGPNCELCSCNFAE